MGLVFVLWFPLIPDDGAQKAPTERAELAWEGAGAVAPHSMSLACAVLCPHWTDTVHPTANVRQVLQHLKIGLS